MPADCLELAIRGNYISFLYNQIQAHLTRRSLKIEPMTTTNLTTKVGFFQPLAEAYDNRIIETRKRLEADLTQSYGYPVASRILRVLEARIAKHAPRPLFGELYPWLLYDLMAPEGLDEVTFDTMASQWLASYILTTVIDDAHDEHNSIHPGVLMPLMVKTAGISRFIRTSESMNWFHEELHKAVQGQLADMAGQRNTHKNSMATAFAIAVIDTLGQNEDCRIALAGASGESLLWIIQGLDDLHDCQEDLRNGRHSHLWSKEDRIKRPEDILGTGSFKTWMSSMITHTHIFRRNVEQYLRTPGNFRKGGVYTEQVFTNLADELSAIQNMLKIEQRDVPAIMARLQPLGQST